jgi:DUF971 family protein
MSATPVEIKLRKASRLLVVEFDDGRSFDLPFEYLRVYSPSADVKSHGPGQGVLQTGKEDVQITSVSIFRSNTSAYIRRQLTSRAMVRGREYCRQAKKMCR